VELFNCTGAATMSTALAATDVQNMTGGSAIDALQYSTSLSGYATAAVTEGTVANYRPFDLQLVAPTLACFVGECFPGEARGLHWPSLLRAGGIDCQSDSNHTDCK
jgi:hypothetical protein